MKFNRLERDIGAGGFSSLHYYYTIPSDRWCVLFQWSIKAQFGNREGRFDLNFLIDLFGCRVLILILCARVIAVDRFYIVIVTAETIEMLSGGVLKCSRLQWNKGQIISSFFFSGSSVEKPIFVNFLCHTTSLSCVVYCVLTHTKTSHTWCVCLLFLWCKRCICVLLQVTQTEVERLKSSYRHAARDAAQAKRKFHEANKGEDSWYHSLIWPAIFIPVVLFYHVRCIFYHHHMMCRPLPVCWFTDKERDRAKERYVKASVKYHEVHNEYVLSVRAAQVYHQHHYSQIQPALLGALQTLQQEMVLIL